MPAVIIKITISSMVQVDNQTFTIFVLWDKIYTYFISERKILSEKYKWILQVKNKCVSVVQNDIQKMFKVNKIKLAIYTVLPEVYIPFFYNTHKCWKWLCVTKYDGSIQFLTADKRFLTLNDLKKRTVPISI